MLFVVYRTFLHVTPFVRAIRTTSSQRADVEILISINLYSSNRLVKFLDFLIVKDFANE